MKKLIIEIVLDPANTMLDVAVNLRSLAGRLEPLGVDEYTINGPSEAGLLLETPPSRIRYAADGRAPKPVRSKTTLR